MSPPKHEGEITFIASATVQTSMCDVLTGHAALSQATQTCLRNIMGLVRASKVPLKALSVLVRTPKGPCINLDAGVFS